MKRRFKEKTSKIKKKKQQRSSRKTKNRFLFYCIQTKEKLLLIIYILLIVDVIRNEIAMKTSHQPLLNFVQYRLHIDTLDCDSSELTNFIMQTQTNSCWMFVISFIYLFNRNRLIDQILQVLIVVH